ncbi:pyroglutamyl-peptidase I family protein [Streptomyces glomeratus]|uniref:Pyroglutamyl peptidase n=1 Tax=Streptomyces glomeratus TaxID=284452 RepID=A0ABP6M430_9ACTN|nr:pyroglutamyl peptidase [Streptomyces glomeratus]MCF1506938.1 pyroglutamyl peptidase [Streptomyces glomeratus]
MHSIRVRIGILSLALLAGFAAPGTATADSAPSATVEEQRLDRAVPQEILRRSGFDSMAPRLARALAEAHSYAQAERAVVRQGSLLWRRAVERAQGRGPTACERREALPCEGGGGGAGLSPDDDRPLYWARLGMTREVRSWEPEFGLSDEQRARLLSELEVSSRGQDSVRFPLGRAVKRILVTGFDPFTLDRDIRISNPSGATALALDGTTIQTAGGPARIEAVVFPVRWQDFADGTVERTLRRHLPRVDLFTTVSQGRIGRFDIERTNGAWRGGFPDNDGIGRTETIPVPDPATQPQWTSTTLPYRAITSADTGRFPVFDHTEVTEIPAGGGDPVVRPDGPTFGSTARAGGGGNYLSNEIAYRATLLRDRLGLHDRLPGGHVHTPVLEFGAGNTDPATGAVTDPAFVRNRLDIVAQVRAIVTAAANATFGAGVRSR